MLKTILNFTKIEHTAFSLPLLFTGAWYGGGRRLPDAATMGLIIMAAVGARIFGMACNRIFDRHLDALNPRTRDRELPSGKMSLRQALAVAVSGLGLYLAACILLGGWCLVLAPVPLVALLGYSLLKRFTWLCHLGIGLSLAQAPIGAYIAASDSLALSGEVILFAFFVFTWLSGADVIYALLDIDSDRRHRIYSLPARFGVVRAQQIAAGFHALSLILLAALLKQAGAGIWAWCGFAVTVVFFGLMYLPRIPVPVRFFPIATLAGVFGALAPLLA